MNTFNKTFASLLVVLLLLPLQACALSGDAIEGKVLEEGTEKPIPGAIVVARWTGTIPTLGHSSGACVHVEFIITDEHGRYRLPAWHKSSQVGPVLNIEANVSVYKPGYQRSTVISKKEGIEYLKPFTGGRVERLRAVWSSGVQCGSAGESEKNLISLYRALYEEAKPLAQTDEDRKIVNALLYELEKRELGYEVATKRMLERK